MAAFLPTIEIVLPGATPQKHPGEEPQKLSAYRKCTKTGALICKKTGKLIKKGTIIWPIKFLLSLLDLLAAPFGHMAGRDINFPILYKVGAVIILVSVWVYHLINSSLGGLLTEVGFQPNSAGKAATLVKIIFPGFLALMGTCMIIGGKRLQLGRSFKDRFRNSLEPLPAFESGIIFKLGDVKLSLRDTHTGIGAFGGIGSGKTVSLMVPMMRQFFRQLRDDDDTSEYAKCGALILDEKGDFIDSTITEMLLANRSLQDLVIIDPDLDLYRYNPLDPNQTADENAAKLAKVQKILGTSSGGDNAYWDQTSQSTIKFFLQLLEVYKPKHKIGLDDVARFMRDDDMATVLCDQVEKTIEEKKQNNEISEEAYGSYTDAISNTRNAWIQLNPNTKSTLKTTITNMLGPIASNPRLQKVFCRDTNFSFRDLPNNGKVVLFRGSGIDKATARLICVCLKIDFQTWQKRRNGSAATAYALNTTRTVLFICDEYQEFVTCGGEGDETFYGVSRSTRTAPIVATQSYNSLETAIKNKEQTKTLRQNIATWVFFRSTDQDTCELGKFLAGQSKKEDFSTSQDTTGFMETASNLSGSGGGKGSSINISKKLEENFRADDFSRLVTMTMEKSKTGPWYSEAIVYHYHDIDDSAESRCYKTRLTHLYYDNKLRKQASLNVKHLDHILYDRNWQRKSLQRGLLLIQDALQETAKEKESFAIRQKNSDALKHLEDNKKTDPREATRQTYIQSLTQEANTRIQKEGEYRKTGFPGEINLQPESFETLTTRKAQLEKNRYQASSAEEIENIDAELYELNRKISVLRINQYKDKTEGKEILRADDNLLEEEFHAEPSKTNPNQNQNTNYTGSKSNEYEDEDENETTDQEIDSLWEDSPSDRKYSLQDIQSELQALKKIPSAILQTPIDTEVPTHLLKAPTHYEDTSEDSENEDTNPYENTSEEDSTKSYSEDTYSSSNENSESETETLSSISSSEDQPNYEVLPDGTEVDDTTWLEPWPEDKPQTSD